MARLELWRWLITDPERGVRYATRHRMCEADAVALDPAAERVPGTLEVREVADDVDQLRASSMHPKADPRPQ